MKCNIIRVNTEDLFEPSNTNVFYAPHTNSLTCIPFNTVESYQESWRKQLTEKHYKPQHLYAFSNNEIKTGDWAINTATKFIYRVADYGMAVLANMDKAVVSKIIGTTDESLHLQVPIISKEFTSSYRKYRDVTEYQWRILDNGEIDIYAMKNHLTKDEVEEICDLYESIIHGDFHVMTEEDMRKRIRYIKTI